MTTNHIGRAKNVNTGSNHGYINQNDNQGAIPQASKMYLPTASSSQLGGGPGSLTHANRRVPQETVNYIDDAKNVNTGHNYGTINQNDNRPVPNSVASVRVPTPHPAMPASTASSSPTIGSSFASSSKGSTNPLGAITSKHKRT